MTGARLLIVDDEAAIRRAVRTNLGHHGFVVDTAADGAEALSAFRDHRPDVVLLDLGLPDMDGAEIIAAIREQTNTPIIVLSARGAEQEKVRALDLGADDYLTKPFGVSELLARVRVALRHAARPSAGTAARYRSDVLEVDFEHRRVLVRDAEVHLTPTEYDLLKVFVAHPGKVLTDSMLLRHVWGQGYGADPHYLHVYIARLRKKLEPLANSKKLILNEPGVGYRFIPGDPVDRSDASKS